MKIKFSCVLEYSPLMAVQSYIWIQSLLNNNIQSDDIYIHIIGEIPKELHDYFKKNQVNIIWGSVFHVENKYCNKLIQLETFLNLKEEFDYVFLMDCDTALVSLEELKLKENIYAKIVDFPNPPIKILRDIFNEEGFEIKETNTSFPKYGRQITDWNNCNGGVYIIKKEFLPRLAPKWKDYALRCMQHQEIFTPSYKKHADQVGFALAMKSLDVKVGHLELKWNFPTHIDSGKTNTVPSILHYHDQIDEHLKLKKVSSKSVNKSITKVNKIISESFKSNFDNSLFWNLRYSLYPNLGSGIGSRGEILNYKKRLLFYTTQGFMKKNVWDIGCGDLELTRSMNYQNYTGFDISREALGIAKKKRPEWDFLNINCISNGLPEADLIICFDVVIHQANEKDYYDLLNNILNNAKERVVIAGYNDRPSYVSDITNFYNSLLEDISDSKKFNEINLCGQYRDVSIIVASKVRNNHSRDIGSAKLNKAYRRVKRPDLLQFLVDVSRENFGFYTSHFPRVFEYSWILEKLEGKTGYILDIGAGVCPLPLCLAKTGWKVVTVDSHTKVRDLDDKDNWNEWGFLDYSIIDPEIQSFNVDFGSCGFDEKLDMIYSVSVIEHMPSKSRRDIIEKASQLLKPDGELLLTVDVVPKTNQIWNHSEGKKVESKRKHGKLKNLKKELREVGFEIVEETIQRNIEFSRTDIFYIRARLNEKRNSKNYFFKWLK